jgi:hypothetical protein
MLQIRNPDEQMIAMVGVGYLGSIGAPAGKVDC